MIKSKISNVPLAERLRPRSFNDFVGQTHLIGKNGFISRIVQSGNPTSILLWGPPGCGKTTLARLYAEAFDAEFVSFSAVFSGVADLKKVVKDAKSDQLFSKTTILFVDEIHRFNKAQQDAFLPYLEDGTIILVGATTENPSFSLNNALLSRLQTLVLNSLDDDALQEILIRYEESYGKLSLDDKARKFLINLSQGDGRYLLNLVENLHSVTDSITSIEGLKKILQRKRALFDRGGDGHYNLISALHKSVRGSDPDAALYWFARMLEGGEEPLFIARRLIRMASEDIGLADPDALKLAIAARESYHILGSPEGELALAEVVVYLSLAPKSNSMYLAYEKARSLAKETNHLSPPKKILNAPTKLMKEEGYGKSYRYDHDLKHAFSGQNYFPDEMSRQSFYKPVKRGFEREMQKRLEYFSHLREKLGEH